jgi:hypothetical protein
MVQARLVLLIKVALVEVVLAQLLVVAVVLTLLELMATVHRVVLVAQV